MKQIPLSNGGFAIVDDDVFEKFNRWKWSVSAQGYPVRNFWEDGKSHVKTMHSLVIGHPPQGLITDHRNTNKLDNRRENLRFISKSGNGFNRSSPKGVHFHRATGKWAVQFTFNYKTLYFGEFEDKQEALSIAHLLKGTLIYHELTKGIDCGV